MYLAVVVMCVGWVDGQLSQATAAVDRLMEWYDTREGQFDGVGWWHTGNCLTAFVEYSQRTKNTTYNSIVADMFTKNGNFTTEGYDDEGWWGLAWVAAWKLTQIPDYIVRAEAIFADMQLAWSGTFCGGGIWWNRAETYKNAITNELFISLAAELYLATNREQYLNWAVQGWQWFNQSGMINDQYLINDGLMNNCSNNGAPTWTYNQGVILGGLVALYQITEDKNYLLTAGNIATATMTLLSPKGILQEPCEPNCDGDAVQFKGIFMRNLAYLYQATGDQQYINYINANTASLWSNDRSGTSLGLRWAGPFDSADAARQSSALDALNAALLS